MADAKPSGRPVRVLIVEDETLVSMLLSDFVDDAGLEVAGAAVTAQEALQIAEDERPAIAIVDVSLRGEREGIEVGAELGRRYGLELIFISGHGGVGEWPDVQALSPVAVLQKPCLPTQVTEALKAAANASAERRKGLD